MTVGRICTYLTLLFAAMTVSCGEKEAKDQDTSVQEYFRQVEAAFQQAKEDAQSIQLAPEGTGIPREDVLDLFRDYYRRYLEVVKNLRSELSLIDPPIEIEDEHAEALQIIDELINTVEELRSRADQEDPDANLVSGTLEIPYRMDEACEGLQRAADNMVVAIELPCEQATDTQADGDFQCRTVESGVECCSVIPEPDGADTTEGDCPERDASKTFDFGGIRGHFEPMPDLPPSLLAVSEYLVF